VSQFRSGGSSSTGVTSGFEVRCWEHTSTSDASRHFTFRTLTSSAVSPTVSTRPDNHDQFAALVLQRLSPKLISPRQAAALLGVNRETIYRLCARGELPHVRVGSALRVDVAAHLGGVSR
jgi:excisionase family DNA binding protein